MAHKSLWVGLIQWDLPMRDPYFITELTESAFWAEVWLMVDGELAADSPHRAMEERDGPEKAAHDFFYGDLGHSHYLHYDKLPFPQR